MELSEAISLIEGGCTDGSNQYWADFGCGNGLFTLALSERLGAPSRILAVDQDRTALAKIPDQHNGNSIEKRKGDFVEVDIDPRLDGILMANALHYVQDAIAFIQKIGAVRDPSPRLVVIEYDTTHANPWVPFPVSFNRLSNLIAETDFNEVEKLGEIRSRIRGDMIYSALVH